MGFVAGPLHPRRIVEQCLVVVFQARAANEFEGVPIRAGDAEDLDTAGDVCGDAAPPVARDGAR
ncbi:hypothetical protein [Streptomyces pinistramenti]|uniref:hypothetical protein n=1 Tax=Streptomyces pinistramenti TaxID=2884812 RepID=UPI003557038A